MCRRGEIERECLLIYNCVYLFGEWGLRVSGLFLVGLSYLLSLCLYGGGSDITM